MRVICNVLPPQFLWWDFQLAPSLKFCETDPQCCQACHVYVQYHLATRCRRFSRGFSRTSWCTKQNKPVPCSNNSLQFDAKSDEVTPRLLRPADGALHVYALTPLFIDKFRLLCLRGGAIVSIKRCPFVVVDGGRTELTSNACNFQTVCITLTLFQR